MAEIKNYTVYKSKPIVMFSQNNTIIYGNMNERAYAEIVVLGADVSGMLMVTVKSTEDKSVLRPNEFKNGLSEALDYSCEQIERYNKK